MPQVFKIGSYWVYFWADEGKPLEPVHVHIAQGHPVQNATKVWITQNGKCLLGHNKSHIPAVALRNMLGIIEARSKDIVNKWYSFFGEIDYYC